MATNTKILKIAAILALQAFCLTQAGLAGLQKAQNLRPREIGDEAQAGAVGREHEIAKDLLPGQGGVQFTDAMPIEGVIEWVRERIKAGTLKDAVVVINHSGNLVVLASRGKLSNIIDTKRDLLLKILGAGEFDIVCSSANPSFALVRPAEEIEAAAGAAGRGMLTGQGRQKALEALEGLRLTYYAKGPKNVPSIGEPAPFSSDTPAERLRAFQRFMRDPVWFTDEERAGINNELNSAGLNLKDDWGLLGADRLSQASAIGEDKIEQGTALLTEEKDRDALKEEKITNGVALVICPDAGRLNEIKARLKPFGFEFKDIVDAPSAEEAKRKIGQISQPIVVVVNDTGNGLSEEIMLGIGQAKVVVIDKPEDTARVIEEAL